MMKKQILAFLLSITTVLTSIPVYAESVSYVDTVSENSISENTVEIIDGADTTYKSAYNAETAGNYPAKYDPRETNMNTPIRSQFDGTCYIFGVYGAMESNLIKRGLADSTLDLSELHAPYFMSHQVVDPLGNYTDDTEDSSVLFDDYLDGGISTQPLDFLSLWHGPIYESEMPKTEYSYRMDKKYLNVSPDRSLGNKSLFHLKSSKYIAKHKTTDDKVNEIKAFISEYGAVSVSYYSHKGSRALGTGKDYSHYFPGNTTPSHVVTVIGWDDNYDKNNFRSAYLPSRNGAWLCKDSRGSRIIVDETNTETNGYFWMSYDQYLEHIIALDFESADKYANMYAYDGNPTPFTRSVVPYTTSLNIYTAKAYGGKSVEKVDAVMANFSANANYECYVVANPVVKNGKLVSYTGKSNVVKGKSDYKGYYTLTFDEPLYVTNGKTYGIVMKVDRDNTLGCGIDKQTAGICYVGSDLEHLMDAYGMHYNGASSTIPVPEGQGLSPTLRGLTNKASDIVLASSLTLDKTSINLNVNDTHNILYEITPSFTTHKSCGFYSDNEAVAVVDEDGKVTAKGAGTCTITATTYDGECSANLTVTVKAPAKQEQKPNPVVTTTVPSKFTIGDFTYKKLTANTLTVSKIDSDGSVKIPATITYNGVKLTVTAISDKAAKGKDITKLTIPSTVTKIGKGAFANCKDLKTVTIGTGVTSIKASAFLNCSNLKTVKINSKVLKSVGSKAFKGLKENVSIKVPSTKKKAYKKLFKSKMDAGVTLK